MSDVTKAFTQLSADKLAVEYDLGEMTTAMSDKDNEIAALKALINELRATLKEYDMAEVRSENTLLLFKIAMMEAYLEGTGYLESFRAAFATIAATQEGRASPENHQASASPASEV
jgi:hypothetical protein